ncbi:MAG: hypothetical protein WC834_02000 [Eubacteriales bacterium]
MDPMKVTAYSATASALAATVLVIVTIFYAYQTRKQANEAKKLREIQYQPLITAEYALAENKWAVLIRIKNVGNGIATNILIDVSPGITEKDEISRINVSSLVPGQSFDYFVGFVENLPQLKDNQRIKFEINYTDLVGKTFNASYFPDRANVLQRAVRGGVGHEEAIWREHTKIILSEISESLKKISQNIIKQN